MKKERVIQFHHLVYGSPERREEWRIPIFSGEHECVSKMNLYSRKTVSKGFITCLKYFILRNEDRAIDLQQILEDKNTNPAHLS